MNIEIWTSSTSRLKKNLCLGTFKIVSTKQAYVIHFCFKLSCLQNYVDVNRLTMLTLVVCSFSGGLRNMNLEWW